MSEFALELATQADDAAIRRMLAENPMPGHLELSYEREPDYFIGCRVLSPFCQVMLARHDATGELAGVFCRSVRRVYVNGAPADVGYLAQLRVAPRFRGRWLVSRGARWLRELNDDGRAGGYIATIIEGNDEALGVLVEKPRRSLPSFRAAGGLHTLAYLLRQGGRTVAPAPSGAPGLSEVAAFLAEHGPRRQFFPVLTEADLRSGEITPGLRASDWVAVRRGGRLAGVVALWDQSGFKQNVVRGYHGPWRIGRPAYNLWARLTGSPVLPPVGAPLKQIYAAFLCLADDDPALFEEIVGAASRAAAARGFDYLLLGLSDRDPLLAPARRRRHVAYRSTLYTVDWNGGGFHDRLDARVPYVEIASL